MIIELELKVKVSKVLGNVVYGNGSPTDLDRELEIRELESEVGTEIERLLEQLGCEGEVNLTKANHGGWNMV